MNKLYYFMILPFLLLTAVAKGQGITCENKAFYQVRIVYFGDGAHCYPIKEYIMNDTNNIMRLITPASHNKVWFHDSLDIYHAGSVLGCSPRAVLKDSCLGSASEFERMDAYMSLFYKWMKGLEEAAENRVYDDIDSLSMRIYIYKIIGRTRRRVEKEVEYKDIVHIESIKPIHITLAKP